MAVNTNIKSGSSLYSSVKNASGSNNSYNQPTSVNATEDGDSFTDLLASVLGIKKTTNAKTDSKPSASLVTLANNFAGPGGAGKYTATKFDAGSEDFYNEFITKGANASKLLLAESFMKMLKDAEELEKKIDKLMAEANKNNAAAKEALAVFMNVLKEAKKDNKSPQETIARLTAVANNAAAYNEEKAKLDAIKKDSGITDDTTTEDIEEYGKELTSFLDKTEALSNSEAMSLLNNIVSSVSEADSSTKRYLENRKKDDELNEKIKSILQGKMDITEMQAEFNKLNDSLTGGVIVANSQQHMTDLERLNRQLQSPVFA